VLAGLPALSAHTLDRWLDALHELTREQWARVAEESASPDVARHADGIQRAIAAAIQQHRLDVAAWFLRDAVETKLKDRFGVAMKVDVVAPGALDGLTELNHAAKLKRFRDER
jgi:hypothetical protein